MYSQPPLKVGWLHKPVHQGHGPVHREKTPHAHSERDRRSTTQRYIVWRLQYIPFPQSLHHSLGLAQPERAHWGRAGCDVNRGPVLCVVEAQHGVETGREGAHVPMAMQATTQRQAGGQHRGGGAGAQTATQASPQRQAGGQSVVHTRRARERGRAYALEWREARSSTVCGAVVGGDELRGGGGDSREGESGAEGGGGGRRSESHSVKRRSSCRGAVWRRRRRRRW